MLKLSLKTILHDIIVIPTCMLFIKTHTSIHQEEISQPSGKHFTETQPEKAVDKRAVSPYRRQFNSIAVSKVAASRGTFCPLPDDL